MIVRATPDKKAEHFESGRLRKRSKSGDSLIHVHMSRHIDITGRRQEVIQIDA
jgi:hypothetical protein